MWPISATKKTVFSDRVGLYNWNCLWLASAQPHSPKSLKMGQVSLCLGSRSLSPFSHWWMIRHWLVVCTPFDFPIDTRWLDDCQLFYIPTCIPADVSSVPSGKRARPLLLPPSTSYNKWIPNSRVSSAVQYGPWFHLKRLSDLCASITS